MMNSTTRATTSRHSFKHPLITRVNEHKMDIPGTRLRGFDKPRTKGKQACREKKLDLLQDVDRLKKKLRDEENIHRALQRAFNRPLGSLPRLPPCLPQNLLELVAEIAVLEEEVVRLEEQVITYSGNLCQDGSLVSSKKKSVSPTMNSEHNFNRGSHPEIASLSVARTSASSSDIVSDRSSLSLDKSSSTSSDITSDQTGKISSDSSPGNGKSKPYLTHCNSTRNTDAGSLTKRSLLNGKIGLNSSENRKGKRTDQPTFELHLELHRKILLSARKIPRLKSQVK